MRSKNPLWKISPNQPVTGNARLWVDSGRLWAVAGYTSTVIAIALLLGGGISAVRKAGSSGQLQLSLSALENDWSRSAQQVQVSGTPTVSHKASPGAMSVAREDLIDDVRDYPRSGPKTTVAFMPAIETLPGSILTLPINDGHAKAFRIIDIMAVRKTRQSATGGDTPDKDVTNAYILTLHPAVEAHIEPSQVLQILLEVAVPPDQSEMRTPPMIFAAPDAL